MRPIAVTVVGTGDREPRLATTAVGEDAGEGEEPDHERDNGHHRDHTTTATR